MSAQSLDDQADSFAAELSGVVSAFTGEEQPFLASRVGDRVAIRHAQTAAGSKYGIGLIAEKEQLLSLVVEYNCTWDSMRSFLGIETSFFAVFPLDRITKEALFRYEFVRDPKGNVPSAHLQVHAHRDAFTHLLGYAGPHSKRARRRLDRGIGRAPSVSEFHFPLGGPRFRPSLEDILDVLAEEFGLQTGSEWATTRDAGRLRWRRTQLAAAVRDSPETAVQVLRELGYEVSGEVVKERVEKLCRL